MLAISNNRLLYNSKRCLRVPKFQTKKSQRDSVSGWSEVWLKCTFTRESSSDELRTFEPESSIQLTSRGMESPLQGKPMQFCYTVY